MSNNLAPNQSRDLVGSLKAVANARNISIGEVLAEIEIIILFDSSGSMSGPKFTDAKNSLADLQKQFSGKICLISFSDDPIFCGDGIPLEPFCGTALHKALNYVLPFNDTGVHIVVITDGYPDSEEEALEEAAKLNNKISAVFIRSPGSMDEFKAVTFLHKLCRNGGKHTDIEGAQQLHEAVVKLLTS